MSCLTHRPDRFAVRACLSILCATLLAAQALPARAAATPAAAQADPSVVGQWSPPVNLGIVVIHTHVLPNGKVLFWTRDQSGGVDVLGHSQAYVWDPATGGLTGFPFNATTNLFCSGHSFLPDGRLLVTGGHKGRDGVGEPHTNIYDPVANSWSRAADMNAGRWYPTNCALGNGETLVVSGDISGGQVNTLPQVFRTSTANWRSLTTAQQGLPLYPWMLLAPNGRVFNAGPDRVTRFLRTSGTGAWFAGPSSGFGFRDYGGAVMYDDGKVLIAGGGQVPPTASAEVINLSREPLAWRGVPRMAFARRQMNTTLLADGQVLVTGGTSGSGFNNAVGSVLAAEMWNPATERWTTMASMQSRRLYHSTTVLLPDGRVLVGGGGLPAASGGDSNHTDIEIYSPPYLFKGARPTISSAPASVSHGQQFFVGTPNAASITKVTWVRLPSTTHAFDQNQRINHLSFSQAAGGLNVTAPGGGNLCPPGDYMMFLINGNGVPSVARIVRITTPPASSNSIDDSRYFSRLHYYDYLGREPDAGGLNNWASYINGCGNDAACREARRVTTGRGFMESAEFRNRVGGAFVNGSPGPGYTAYNREYVRQCYLVYLRRDPGEVTDPANQGYGWYDALSRTGDYDTTIRGFINSTEYRNRFHKP